MKKLPIFLLSVLFLMFFQTSYAHATAGVPSEEAISVETAVQVVPEEKPPIVIALQTEDAVPASEANRGALIPDVDSNKVASRAVEKNLGLFSKRIKERFSVYLSRSGQYLELMKGLLRSKNVPEDIVFLSLIESGFNPNAYSIARAAGPWQFISSTAKRYGLQINWWKDERRDPVKSTLAAADYLKDLYGMFGSWSLAMAAYNAGEGKISRAIKRNKSDDYWDLLDTRHIRTETKEYVPRFIAASMIASNPEDFGFEDIEYHKPMSYDEVPLEDPIDLTVAADCAGTDLETIKRLNPELRRWCTPPDVPQYILRIPKGTKEAFLENLALFPEEERFTIEKYTVKKGDTLKKIAKRTGIPKQAILSLNDMKKIMPLAAGHVVYLPPKALYVADADDRYIKKASYKVKKASYKVKRKGKVKRYSSRKR
ncbi:MAG: lytic transglycosylase domain-containing protein [Thermodesulfovibrionales bacterium]